MSFTGRAPDYAGGGLVNLSAELERRLGGSPPSPTLSPHIAASIPDARSYVVALFDGMGSHQLTHQAAGALRDSRVADLDAPFPSTTTVSLSTFATGLTPAEHGLIGYQLYLPELGIAVNTIRWTNLFGEPVDFDTEKLLPHPNLWERLAAAGAEPISVQPSHFAGSGLSRALYRGCRFEPVTTLDETVEAAVSLAAVPGRLVFVYLPFVDFAAHVSGQQSREYDDAITIVGWAWEQMAARLPPGACLVGTADHGHIDFPADRRVSIPKRLHRDRVLYGDVRAMFVRGDGAAMAAELPATWVPIAEARAWWGGGPGHPELDERLPDGVLVADDGYVLLAKHSNDRLVGNHGALTDAERRIPLLVAAPG